MSHPTDNKKDSLNKYWLIRWADGDIGWHHHEINEHLLSHWQRLKLKPGSQVFVPLCGKSLDMVWLAQQGHSVAGLEISAKALEEFFSEQGLIAEQTNSEPFQLFQVENYSLLCGDVFQLKPEHIQGVSAVYDRASLVALDAKQRALYAQLMAGILPAGCPVLLVAMDYPQDEMRGPPYTVPEDEIYALFSSSFRITHLDTLDLLKDTDRYAEQGLSRLSEHIYMMKRK